MPGANPNWKKGMDKVENSGRKKGALNKFTQLKDAFMDAFLDKDGFGGTKGLKNWIKASPRNKALFAQMVTKMLPSNITLTGDKDNPIIRIEFVEAKKK